MRKLYACTVCRSGVEVPYFTGAIPHAGRLVKVTVCDEVCCRVLTETLYGTLPPNAPRSIARLRELRQVAEPVEMSIAFGTWNEAT